MDRLHDTATGSDHQVWFPHVEAGHVLQRRMEFWQSSPAPYPRFVVEHLRSVERGQLLDSLEWFEAADLEHARNPASGAHVRVLWHEVWQPHPETWVPTRQAPEDVVASIRARAQGVLPAAEVHPQAREFWRLYPGHRQWLDETPWPVAIAQMPSMQPNELPSQKRLNNRWDRSKML